MQKRQQFSRLRGAQVAVGGVVLFALIAFSYSLEVAAVLCGAMLVAFGLQFHLLHSLLNFFRRSSASSSDLVLGATSVGGAVLLLSLGHALVLSLWFAIWFVLDAVVLRFRSPKDA
jgi:hypothetical protein